MAEARWQSGMARAPSETGGGAPGTVSAEEVTWAFRMFIGRDPAPEEIAFHGRHVSVENLRTAFAQSWEFEQFFNRAKGVKKGYDIPHFLLRPAADPRVKLRFQPPDLEAPVSQLCTAAQFRDPAFAEIAEALAMPVNLHRRLWEHVWMVDVLATEGVIAPGRAFLGLGCKRERIPSLVAARGVTVLATDRLDPPAPGAPLGAQPAGRALDLFDPRLIPIADFERLVSFRPLDPAALPVELAGKFDALWASCAHLGMGSLEGGLAFIEASLGLLKPGGMAVHVTEFNLSSDTETVESPELCVFRRRDLEALAVRLADQGHEMLPLNLYPGHDEEDAQVDGPPFGLPHLKVHLGPYVVTSVGIAIRKRR